MTTCPHYRIRLFLTVDLVGSTAFKAKSGEIGRTKDQPYPEWVTRFRQFYRLFPETLEAEYRNITTDGSFEPCPRVWKTIGDEIIFCVRVLHTRHVARCVSAFLKALDEFGRSLEGDKVPLDVKGSGWIAPFPADNIAIKVIESANGGSPSSDFEFSEEIEADVDNFPHKYDFLGRNIDAGFRFAKNASADKFTASVELGYILAEAASVGIFSGRFSYHGRESLKGVHGDRPVPIVSIDTERSVSKRNVRERERLLTQESEVAPLALRDFLHAFMLDCGVDLPVVAADGGEEQSSLPASYNAFKAAWEEEYKDNEKQDELIRESGEKNNQAGSDILQSSITDFLKAISLNHDQLRDAARLVASSDLSRTIRDTSRVLEAFTKSVSPRRRDKDADDDLDLKSDKED